MDPEPGQVLIDDSISTSSGNRDKVKDKLGLNFDDPEEVLKLKDTTLDARQQRINNRKDNKKACEILGHDPSKEKLAAVLGTDVAQIDTAIDESRRSKYSTRKTFVIKSKNISKALQVLGFDPAVVKAFEILGVEFDTLRDELTEAADNVIASPHDRGTSHFFRLPNAGQVINALVRCYSECNGVLMDVKAAWKLIAPQRMELSARLPIGTKYCVLSLNVDKDGDICELVQRCIQAENLPPYIEQSILSCAAALLEEDRRTQIKESELVASELDAVEAARLLSRQYNNCTVTWRLSDQSQELRRQVTFSEAHHALMNSPLHGEELRQLEESFKMAIVKSIEDRDQSVAQLRERQHSEMEQTMQGQNEDQIQLLIGKHIIQLDQLESRWTSELEQAKQNQKREYQKFIIDVYLKDKSQLSVDTSKEHKMTPAEKRKSLKENKPTSSVTHVNPAVASGLSHVTDVYESFTAYLGSQLRVAYNFNLFVGDVLQLCKLDRIKSPQALIESKSALYSNSLAAVVLLCDTGMSMETPTYREFLSLCHSSTEFHFDDIEQQLQQVRRHSKTLQPGDVFITRHSNLGLCHVVFHLCSDKKNAAAEQSLATLLQGLKNIMALAAQFDVTTLTVPLLLIDEESRHVLSEAQYIRRAETVIKSIRAFLTERLSSNDNALRTIQFSLIQQADELLPDMRRLFESHSSIHHHANSL